MLKKNRINSGYRDRMTRNLARAKLAPFDVVGFIMDYENGGLDDEAIVVGFQHLINDGTVWNLQGSYGRTAEILISNGFCTFPGGDVISD